MTRKDYILIAKIIQDYLHEAKQPPLPDAFAYRLAAANPNFNYKKFLAACGEPE